MNKFSKTLVGFAVFSTFLAIVNATVGSIFNLGAPNEMAFLVNKLNSVIDLLVAAILFLFAIYLKKHD